MDFAELPRAAALFLVAVVGACGFCYGLAVGYARLSELNLDFFIVLKTLFQRAQVEFSLTVH